MSVVNLKGIDLDDLKHLLFLLNVSEVFGSDSKVVGEDILKVNSTLLPARLATVVL